MSFAAQVETGSGESPIGSSLYGVCNSNASDVAKSVPMDNFDTLVPGTTIHIKFTNTNTAANPTLAIGSTDALPIIRYQLVPPGTTEATSWRANSVVALTYDYTDATHRYWRMNDVGAEQAIADAAATALTNAITTSDSAIRAVIAPTYSASSTYKLGALVFYNGYLYRCISAISTAEAWNSSHWSQTKVVPECMPRKGSITLTASSWAGSGPWTQTVSVSGATVYKNSLITLQPDSTALNHMASVGVAAIFVSNNNGTLTAYAIQKKPTSNLTVQCTVEETV